MIMDNVRVNLNSKERLARINSGLESDALHFTMNGQSAEDILKHEAQEKFNTKVEDYIDKFDKHNEELLKYALDIADNAANLEIMPIYNYLLVKPFNENPFQKIKVSDSGLIVDLGGQKPIYKSNETGEYEEEESLIHVGTVLESGKECNYVKEGDTVFWNKHSESPVPFFKLGLVLVNETRVLAVVNEGLKKRFNQE